MKIVYITRPKGKAFSIERVFAPIIKIVSETRGYTAEVSQSVEGKSTLRSMLANIVKYKNLSKEHQICHITCEVRYCATFMRRSSTILTTHDVMSLINPRAPWYAKMYAYWMQFYFPMKHTKYLTCISESTRRELVKRFPWCENKLRVIVNPIDEAFQYIKKEFNSSKPVILHVGTKKNKNLLRVCCALKGIECHLRIVGKLSQEQIIALKENRIDYSNVYGISDEQIVAEYADCDLVSFPSLFEGFGMPIIEAQATGRPVVTSNREPMKTVAGDAAVLVDPESVESVREGFISIIEDSSLRDVLIEHGLMNANNYSPETVAKQYMELYKEVERNM